MTERWSGKADAAGTVRRQWVELKFLAESRLAKSVAEIHSHVAEKDFEVSHRTIERDLAMLQEIFALRTVGNRPQGWLFDRNAPRTLLPGLSAHESLTFFLVEQQLTSLLPHSALAHLAGYFEEARAVLNAEKGRSAAAWSRKVFTATRGQPMLPATVASGVTEAVYDALLGERQIAVTYRNRGGTTKKHTLHPLGLAVRDTTTFLVALSGEYENPYLYVLHRMQCATVLASAARKLPGFDVREFIERQVPFPLSEGVISLVLRVDEAILASFEETPLSRDQTIEKVAENAFYVHASVRETRTLRAFLLGFGATLEVIEPASLRLVMQQEAAAMAMAYSVDVKQKTP